MGLARADHRRRPGTGSGDDSPTEPHTVRLPAFTRLMQPLVDLAAGVPASVHTKLLTGFLAGAALVLLIAALSEVVIGHMSQRMADLTVLQDRLDRARQMEFQVTAQSHYRAMALLTNDSTNNDKIIDAKRIFGENLDSLEQSAPAEERGLLAHVQEVNDRYAAAGERVLALYLAGTNDAAMQLHLHEEHPISHDLETSMRQLEAGALRDMSAARAAYESDRPPLSGVVWGVSAVSLALALVLGFVLSWAFITPVRRINKALASLASGDFRQRVSVINRDEFGSLAENLNKTSEQLDALYLELRGVSENLQAVVDNALDGIVTLDAQGTIRTFNPVARAIFGYAPSEAIGQPIARLVPGLVGPNGVTSGRRELEGWRMDGSTFPAEVAASEMLVRDERGFIVILRDISERKRVLAELALARDMALEASRAKSSFVANMSHELRTPLNAIIGYSELLEEEARDLNHDEFVPDLQRINGAGKHLLGLINEVLDLSKIEAGKMELFPESFAVESVVNEVCDLVEPLIEQNGNTLKIVCPASTGSMYADMTKVRQVLFNLLSNASKFTQRGNVALEVERTKEDHTDWLTFRVSDSGIGMTPEQMGKLFQRFSQADSATTNKYGGTGLGLALCRNFCEMMGGGVSVTSEFGQGSVFTVRLPAVMPDPSTEHLPLNGISADSPVPDEELAADAPTILVIDDDPTARDLLTRALTREHFRVHTAADAQEGLRLARELRPGAITLDVFMPGVDGWSTLTALKADAETADIPVIMITVSEDSMRLSVALGATEYLTKPVDRQRLVDVLRTILTRSDSPTVLVVDDDRAARQMLVRTVEREGWRAIEAENGRQALDQVALHGPDAILLDLIMPDMDGFAFVVALRANPDWQSIPVVVISALDLTPEERQRLNGSVQRILHKGGVEVDGLMSQVRKLISARRRDDATVGV
jgi:PAS domain S-box-containing protein